MIGIRYKNASDAIIFETVDIYGTGKVSIIAVHSEIHFYTWGDTECCLPIGSTRASLLNEPLERKANPERVNVEDSNVESDSECQHKPDEQENSYSHAKVQGSASKQAGTETNLPGTVYER
ncbi:MAG: hypothetical protein IPH22_08610 [Nitrosomonas sp.]|nr:hypothetical protein [Nitrosomonas sp.]